MSDDDEDISHPKEPALKRATRMWRNNLLRQKIKSGKSLVRLLVDPDCIDYDNKKVHLEKDAPPEPRDIIENEHPEINRLERKFLKDIRAMLNDHKRISMAEYIAIRQAQLYQQKRVLLLEKLRRLEASAAAKRPSSKLKGPDLFAQHDGQQGG